MCSYLAIGEKFFSEVSFLHGRMVWLDSCGVYDNREVELLFNQVSRCMCMQVRLSQQVPHWLSQKAFLVCVGGCMYKINLHCVCNFLYYQIYERRSIISKTTL